MWHFWNIIFPCVFYREFGSAFGRKRGCVSTHDLNTVGEFLFCSCCWQWDLIMNRFTSMLFLAAESLRLVLLFVHLPTSCTDEYIFPVDLDVCTESTGAYACVCVCVAGTASSRMRDWVFVPQRPSLSLSGLYCLSLGANTHQTSRPAFGFMSICWLD